jgi:hypothetical protein
MHRLLFYAALLMAPATASASCGAAFCSVNTSWDAHGGWLEPGARLDLRYEHIRQDQPRAGRRDVGVGEISRHHDEQLTLNRNLLATLDYTLNQDWGVNLLAPIIDRHHDHIHNHRGAQLHESWDFSRVGDVRVMARRRLHSSEDQESHRIATSGVNLGLKLPTGQTNVRNAAGDLAERSLQPGSGTTDLVAGANYSVALPMRSLSWFMQALAQLPLGEKDDYRPGHRVNLDLGARYDVGDHMGLLLQLNALFRARDQGAEAEPEDTGGRFMFVSPGVSYAFTRNLQVYAFVQLPLYQDVNGVQLVARHAIAVGLNMRF